MGPWFAGPIRGPDTLKIVRGGNFLRRNLYAIRGNCASC
jgi:hypothetical protein